MSSPSENLKKIKRQPLPSSGSGKNDKLMKYKNISDVKSTQKHESSSNLSDKTVPLSRSPPNSSSLPYSLLADQYLHKDLLEGIQREVKRNSSHSFNNIKDSDLVSSMASRLATVERELLNAKREIIEKESYIKKLEERLSSSTEGNDTSLRLMALQKQVDEMEEFLNDYGLIWVGNNTSFPPPSSPSLLSSPTSFWSPHTSTQQHFNVDFNLIVSNICSLNALAGEDCPRITHTPNGAQLKVPQPIPLALYSNGLLMFDGPFRPYTDPATQEFIQDLTDGYFPTELKHSYPDGVPFKITDKRYEEYYHAPHKLFPGTGQKLTDDHAHPSSPLSSSFSPHSSITTSSNRRTQTSNPHSSSPMSVSIFLSRIPKTVIKSGQVINIHEGLTETLKGSNDSPHQVKLVDTPVLKEIKKRLEFNDENEEERSPHDTLPGGITTLRIKSENGETTYVLKMYSTETIADIHTHLNTIRSINEGQGYVLKSAFPRQSFTIMNATLEECGLCPSANLFLTSSTIK